MQYFLFTSRIFVYNYYFPINLLNIHPHPREILLFIKFPIKINPSPKISSRTSLFPKRYIVHETREISPKNLSDLINSFPKIKKEFSYLLYITPVSFCSQTIFPIWREKTEKKKKEKFEQFTPYGWNLRLPFTVNQNEGCIEGGIHPLSSSRTSKLHTCPDNRATGTITDSSES